MELNELEQRYYTGDYNSIIEEDNITNPFHKIYTLQSLTTMGQFDNAKALLDTINSFSEAPDILVQLAYYVSAIDYYLRNRDLDTAEDFLKDAMEASHQIEDSNGDHQRYFGRIIRLSGTVAAYRGEYIHATEQFSAAISLQKRWNDNHELSRALSNRAAVLYWLGDIDSALNDALESFQIVETAGIVDTENYIGITNNIGLIYYSMNQLDKALSFFQKSLNSSENLGNSAFVALNLHNLIRTHSLRQEYEKGEEYLNKFENKDHPHVSLIYRVSKGILYLKSGRISKIAEGQRILNDVISEEVIDHQFTILAIFTAMDYLFLELEKFETTQIFDEIHELLDRINEIATMKAVRPAFVQSNIIQSRLDLIEGNPDMAKERLSTAFDIAKSLGLNALSKLIEVELEELNLNYDFIKSGKSLTNSVKTANVIQLLKDIKNNQLVAKYDQLEQPKFLIILNLSGIPIYTKKFAETDINEYLISGFLTAVGAFGQETFKSESLATKLNFQGNSILMERNDNAIFAYGYQDDTPMTQRRFSTFIEHILNIEDLHPYLSAAKQNSILPLIKPNLKAMITEAINKILLSK